MYDLTNFDVKANRPLTTSELNERVEKGLIKHGDIVELYNEWGYPVKTEIWILSAPPGCNIEIEKLKKDNWQNKHRLKVICKNDVWLWAYMKENNIIPKDIADKIETETEEEKSRLMEFWN